MDKRQEDEVSLGTLRSSSTEMQKSLQSGTLWTYRCQKFEKSKTLFVNLEDN